MVGLMLLTGCHEIRGGLAVASLSDEDASLPMAGTFDNHEQVWQSRTQQTAAPPHVVLTLEPQPPNGWTLWRVHLDTEPPLDSTWAMQRRIAADGSVMLTPYRSLTATPGSGKDFEASQWAALDACSLHETSVAYALHANADAAACATIAPGIGSNAALLPLSFEREGEFLHIRFYADQARGAAARENLRRVHWFSGWAAINGAGPKASAESKDWHMNRGLRLSSEGGRAELEWRDGAASGYSIALERLTYRQSHTPILKLSVIEDASAQVLTYAWANPEATRIGLNLGWLQIGLDEQGSVPNVQPQ